MLDSLIQKVLNEINSYYLNNVNDSVSLMNTVKRIKEDIEGLSDIRCIQDQGAQMMVANQWAYSRDLKKILLISLIALIE